MRTAAGALVAAFLFSGVASAEQLSIATSPQGTASYSMGAALAKLISEKVGIPARVQPYSGNSVALPALNNGEIDFSICNEIEAVEALNGDGSYQGRKQQNLRMVSLLYPFTVAIYVKKDSPLQTIADLKGQRLTWGYTAMATIKQVVGAMLANGGLTEKDIRPVLVPNVNRGAEDFASGKADAFFHATGTAKVTETDASVGGLRALAMSDAPEAVAAMKKVLPQGYVTEIAPRQGLPGFDKPTKSLGYDYTFIVGKHVPDEIVYRVTKALAANKELLVDSFSGFSGFDPARMAKKMEVEFHPGAVKYLAETHQWPAK
jgi:TRAP transporter TAXI family solute receptor